MNDNDRMESRLFVEYKDLPLAPFLFHTNELKAFVRHLPAGAVPTHFENHPDQFGYMVWFDMETKPEQSQDGESGMVSENVVLKVDEDTVESLKEQVKTLSESLGNAKRVANEKGDRIRELEGEMNSLVIELNEATRRADGMDEKINGQCRALEKELEEARENARHVMADRDENYHDALNANFAANTAREERDALASELEEANEQNQELSNRLTLEDSEVLRDLDSAGKQLADSLEENKRLNNECIGTARVARQAQDQLTSARCNIERLNKEAEYLRTRIFCYDSSEELCAKNDDLQQRLSAAEQTASVSEEGRAKAQKDFLRESSHYVAANESNKRLYRDVEKAEARVKELEKDEPWNKMLQKSYETASAKILEQHDDICNKDRTIKTLRQSVESSHDALRAAKRPAMLGHTVVWPSFSPIMTGTKKGEHRQVISAKQLVDGNATELLEEFIGDGARVTNWEEHLDLSRGPKHQASYVVWYDFPILSGTNSEATRDNHVNHDADHVTRAEFDQHRHPVGKPGQHISETKRTGVPFGCNSACARHNKEQCGNGCIYPCTANN